MVKRAFVIGVCAVAIGQVTAGSAFAGEVTGNGDPTGATEHANSICVFSGKNDNPTEAFPFGGVSQSYGQLVSKGLKDLFPSPGVACNGHSGFLAGGGGE